jgi:hypothetical protein
MLGDGGDDYMTLGSTLTAGHQYTVSLKARLNAGASTQIKFGSSFSASQAYFSFTPTGTEATYEGTFVSNGTAIYIGLNGGAGGFNGIAFEIDDVSVKEITPTGWTAVGTFDATAYTIVDESAGTIQYVADDTIYWKQDELTAGTLYYYEIVIDDVTSGSLRLYNSGCAAYDKPLQAENFPSYFLTAGTHSGVFEAGSSEIWLRVNSRPCDITVSSISIKPYTPSHVNTDPRFDRQTEGSDVLGGDGDCATDFMTEKGTGWSHDAGNGEYDCDGSQSDTSNLRKASVVTQNVRYKITFTVSNYSTGNVRVYPGGSGGEIGTWRSSDGTFTEYLTSKAAAASFYIQADADFTGSVDDIAVIPVTLSDYTGNNWYPADENGGAIHVAGESGFVYQTVGVTDTHYMFLWKHSGRTSGSIEPYAGGTEGTSVSADGVYSEIIKCGSTNAYLGLDPTTGFDGVLEYLYIIPLSSGPVAHCTGSQSAASNLYSAAGIISDYTNYKGAVTVANRSAGALTKLYFGSAEGIVDVSADADDTYTRYGNSGDSDDRIYLKADADFVGDITALSVKEVTRHAKGTMLLALTPGWDEQAISGGAGIVNVMDDETGLIYYFSATGEFVSYDGSAGAFKSVSHTANTTYLVAVQWGDVLSNVNNMRVGAVAIASPWTSGAWGSDVEFDGAYTLGTDLNLFYSKFGPNNLRDLMFFDRILTDKEIEHFRKQIN